jgi:ribosomal protein L29
VKLEERRRLHNLTIDELKSELADMERTLIELQFAAGMNQLSNPASLGTARKKVAVLHTIIHEKEILANTGFATFDEYRKYRNDENKVFRAERKAR